MLKQKVIITVILFIFSIYYTNKGIKFIKLTDPLMKEIINKKCSYEIKPENAIITANFIIPGKQGTIINLNQSYHKMKKLNYFNETLLVYQNVFPKKSLKYHYHKIVLKGNNIDNNISLVFDIKNLKNYKIIKKVLDSHHLIGNYYLSNKLINQNINGIILSDVYSLKTNYCVTNNINIKPKCILNKTYTILLKKPINKFPFSYTKKNLINGSILFFSFNEKNINELPLIINYIFNNNYHIVSMDQLLKE